MAPIEAQEQIRPSCEFCSIPETRGTDLFRQLYGVDQVITSIPIDKSMTLMQDVVPLGEGGGTRIAFTKKSWKRSLYFTCFIEQPRSYIYFH